jgi:hypothetical protein
VRSKSAKVGEKNLGASGLRKLPTSGIGQPRTEPRGEAKEVRHSIEPFRCMRARGCSKDVIQNRPRFSAFEYQCTHTEARPASRLQALCKRVQDPRGFATAIVDTYCNLHRVQSLQIIHPPSPPVRSWIHVCLQCYDWESGIMRVIRFKGFEGRSRV